jgi:hypothetical protein
MPWPTSAIAPTQISKPADGTGVSRFGRLSPTETFLVAERIELGILMDLCATYLDRLEDFYDLFADDDAKAAVRDDIVVGLAAARSAAKSASATTAAVHPVAGETAQ